MKKDLSTACLDHMIEQKVSMSSWRPSLKRKGQLGKTLDGVWFVNLDADEIRLPPRSGRTLDPRRGLPGRGGARIQRGKFFKNLRLRSPARTTTIPDSERQCDVIIHSRQRLG
jgi:hypothetical protein